MNKRILCLLLSLIMLLSVVLTGCSKKTDDDIKEDITEEASRNTVTLTMYLMSENEISEDQVEKIEKEVNKITKSKFKAKLVLRYFTSEQYQTELEKAFTKTQDEIAARKAAEQALKDAIKRGEATSATTSEETTAEETVVNEYGVTELKYPDVTDHQVDIFYLGGIENFDKFMRRQWLSELDDMITGDSKKITDYILPEYLSNFKKTEDGTYAIPNNDVIGEYTYLLLDKRIMAAYDYAATDTFDTLTCANVQDILKKVDQFHRDDFVPLYSNRGELDLTNVQFLGLDENGKYSHDFSVMGGYYTQSYEFGVLDNFYPCVNIFNDTKVVDQIRTLVKYKELGYYAKEDEADKPFAVGYVKGGLEVLEQYGDNYEVIVLERPRMSTDDVYDNMFAVGSYTSNLSRSMEVITYLNTNVEFRNLILYGIENENYKIIETEIDGVTYKTVSRLNNDYMMDPAKTGNVMIAYPLEGELPNIREYQKRQNIEAVTELDFGFKLDFDDNIINLDAMEQVRLLSEEIYAELIAINTTEELDKFLNGYTYTAEVEGEMKEITVPSARNRVENNPYSKIMKDANYEEGSPAYEYYAPSCGDGVSLAYVYMQWLESKGIYIPEA